MYRLASQLLYADEYARLFVSTTQLTAYGAIQIEYPETPQVR